MNTGVTGKLTFPGGLGRELEVFDTRNKRLLRTVNSLLTVLLFCGAVGLLLYAGYNGYTQYYRHGPAVVWRTMMAPGIGGLLLLAAGLVALWATIRNWIHRVVFHENGLAYTDWRGTRAWLWPEISSVRTSVVERIYTGLIGHTTHRYTLIRRDGSKLDLDDSLEQVDRLAGLVRAQVVPLIFFRYNNAFNTGQTLVFGPVRIHRTGGIEIGKQQYDWNQLKEMTVQNGVVQFMLWVSQDGVNTTQRLPVAAIPNVDVLLSIVDQIPGTLVDPDETTMVVPPNPE